jgi:hypothetical protein
MSKEEWPGPAAVRARSNLKYRIVRQSFHCCCRPFSYPRQ